MKNKKISLWVIIILLIILLPITIFSTTMHFKNKPQEVNPNHDLKYNGDLYFYKDNRLLGTYHCQNFNEYCDYAVTRVKSDYSLDERQLEEEIKLPIIDDRFVFITDSKTQERENSEILLYDLSFEKVIARYKEIKNYGIGISGDYYIMKNQDNLWGVVSFSNGINLHIPFQYDYIGLIDKIDNETQKIASNIFAVSKNGVWQLIDINNATFTDELINEIFTYNNEYIVQKEFDTMKLIDYKNNLYLDSYKYINFYNKYIEILTINNEFYLYDLNGNKKVSNTYMVNSIEEVKLQTEDNKIQIIKNGKLEETIAIN